MSSLPCLPLFSRIEEKKVQNPFQLTATTSDLSRTHPLLDLSLWAFKLFCRLEQSLIHVLALPTHPRLEPCSIGKGEKSSVKLPFQVCHLPEQKLCHTGEPNFSGRSAARKRPSGVGTSLECGHSWFPSRGWPLLWMGNVHL